MQEVFIKDKVRIDLLSSDINGDVNGLIFKLFFHGLELDYY